MLKGIIFDFDGVIAESVQVKTDAFTELYASYGTEIVKQVVEHHKANGGMSRFGKIEYYHKSFLNKSLTKAEIEKLANQFSELVREKVIVAPYVPGALEYIKECYKQYDLFISTGTPTDEIKQILIDREIAYYFTDVFGSPQEKDEHISIILSEYDMSANELLFYGDSDTDLEATEYHNINFVLRIHEHNQTYFNNYSGYTIQNFISMDVNTFFSNERVI